MAPIEDLDDLFTHLGTGRWHYRIFVASLMVPALNSINLVGSDFLNPEPKYSCQIPDDNYTRAVNGSLCSMQVDLHGELDTVPCKKWNYDTSVFHSTVSMEWDLVCERAWIAPLFQAIYTAGTAFGAILGAVAASRYGRRMAVRIGSYLLTCTTIMMLLVPWISGVLVARFLMGTGYGIMLCPAIILSLEICKPNLRTIVGVVIVLPYAVMMVGVAGVSYFVRHWRWLQAICSYPCLILLPLTLIIDESPRWLVVTGRLEEAVKVFEKAIKLNKAKLPDDLNLKDLISSIHMKQTCRTPIKPKYDSDLHNESSHEDRVGSRSIQENGTCHKSNSLGLDDGIGHWWAGPVALFRTAVMRKIMLVLIAKRILQGMIYIGIPLNSGAFSSPFLYMAMLGLVEIPAYCVTAPLTSHFGRKKIAIPCLIGGGVSLFIYVAIREAGIHKEWVHMVFVFLSYLLVCIAYEVNVLFTPELVPTTLRPLGTSTCLLSACLGFCIAPFITDKSSITSSWIPSTVFGSCGIIAGILMFLLPETNGRPLPETVADLRDRLKRERLQRRSETTAEVSAVLDSSNTVAYGSTESQVPSELPYTNSSYQSEC